MNGKKIALVGIGSLLSTYMVENGFKTESPSFEKNEILGVQYEQGNLQPYQSIYTLVAREPEEVALPKPCFNCVPLPKSNNYFSANYSQPHIQKKFNRRLGPSDRYLRSREGKRFNSVAKHSPKVNVYRDVKGFFSNFV